MIFQLEEWIKRYVDSQEEIIDECRKKILKKVIISIIVSVCILVAIGFIAGYEVSYIIKVHFPIGVGFGLFASLMYLLDYRKISKEALIRNYKKCLKRSFKSEEEQLKFCSEIDISKSKEVSFFVKLDNIKFKRKVVIGPKYWIYSTFNSIDIINVEDIDYLCVWTQFAKVGLEGHLKKTAIGVNISAIKKGSKVWSYKKNRDYNSMFFQNGEIASEVLDIIKEYCPNLKIDETDWV